MYSEVRKLLPENIQEVNAEKINMIKDIMLKDVKSYFKVRETDKSWIGNPYTKSLHVLPKQIVPLDKMYNMMCDSKDQKEFLERFKKEFETSDVCSFINSKVSAFYKGLLGVSQL